MLKKVFLITAISFFSFTAFSQVIPVKKNTVIYNPIKIVPVNYYAKHLGFFCTNELRLQKAAGVNVFFRLGSKEYVDYLEQKPNAKKQQL